MSRIGSRASSSAGEATFLLAEGGPDGVAEIRLRPSIMTGALDAYLEELYVALSKRGQGLGRALLEAAMDVARGEGAARIELGTSEDDAAARALYEGAGFPTARAGRRPGDVLLRARPLGPGSVEAELSDDQPIPVAAAGWLFFGGAWQAGPWTSGARCRFGSRSICSTR